MVVRGCAMLGEVCRWQFVGSGLCRIWVGRFSRGEEPPRAGVSVAVARTLWRVTA